jgi:hypothetical protein
MASKTQIHIDPNTTGRCPSCNDKFSATEFPCKPVWSDAFDDIVCYWCARYEIV